MVRPQHSPTTVPDTESPKLVHKGLDEKEKDVLEALLRKGKLTTYGLGKAIGVGKTLNNTAVKNRAQPLIQEGLIHLQKTEEDGVEKHYYSLTDYGKQVALQTAEERLVEYEDRVGELKKRQEEVSK